MDYCYCVKIGRVYTSRRHKRIEYLIAHNRQPVLATTTAGNSLKITCEHDLTIEEN